MKFLLKNKADPKVPLFYIIPKLHKLGKPVPKHLPFDYGALPIHKDANPHTHVYCTANPSITPQENLDKRLRKISRPICASHSAVSTPLAIWVNHYLQPWAEELITATSGSRHLVKILSSYRCGPMAILLTADVAALYPSIDTKHALGLLRQPMTHKFGEPVGPLLHKALSFLLWNHYISFNDLHWKQRSGTAMGVQFAPAYANLYIWFLLKDIIQNVLDSSTVGLWISFIDDILIVFNGTLHEADTFTQSINTHVSQYGISLEWDKGNNATYLDLELSIKGTEIQFKPYSKSINKYLYIPYISCHPHHSKVSFINTELCRLAQNSCTKLTFLSAAAAFRAHLRARGYPASMIREIYQSNGRIWQEQVSYRHGETTSHLRLQGNSDMTTMLTPRVFCTSWSTFTKQARLRALLNPNPMLGKVQQLTDRARTSCVNGRLVIAYKGAGQLGPRLISASMPNIPEDNSERLSNRVLTL